MGDLTLSYADSGNVVFQLETWNGSHHYARLQIFGVSRNCNENSRATCALPIHRIVQHEILCKRMEAPLKSFDNAKGRRAFGSKADKASPFWGFFLSTNGSKPKEGSFIWFVVLALVVFKCRVENVDPFRLT